ncbi:hypothetical protein TNCT_136501 [Trichonephila clavata]|uniref:Uncharacterized protein n=1 Tax=Trichonephila clavata TaxID=2740835 RepID=A0A8X6LW35_TRICU|nr:hypothetical protein TNCT_136501 [Trichonephila clavata]
MSLSNSSESDYDMEGFQPEVPVSPLRRRPLPVSGSSKGGLAHYFMGAERNQQKSSQSSEGSSRSYSGTIPQASPTTSDI